MQLQGPKDSTGEDQVRAGVNTRSRGTEWLVSLRDARLRDGVQPRKAKSAAWTNPREIDKALQANLFVV